MTPAARLDGIEEYFFSRKLAEISAMNAGGAAVINLGIGSPDGAPHPTVLETLYSSAVVPGHHGYQSYRGLPQLRQAMADWYARWYGVTVDGATEVLPLAGSKEGILHISMALLNPGDAVLLPSPGYPAYATAARLAGANVHTYALKEEGGWQPDLEALANTDLMGVKLMWVNYPHMPTGAKAEKGLFEKLILFGMQHHILICHDNPYSFILNDKPQSILSIPGALDTALELNSFSKSHNMAGWRVGMLLARKDIIDTVLRYKSNGDSGQFRPVQEAAIAALALGEDWFAALNATYRQRQISAFALLDALGCDSEKEQAGLFVWGRLPAGKSGWEESNRLLHQNRVFVTPGGVFGEATENYLRISLCSPAEVMEEALQRLKTLPL